MKYPSELLCHFPPTDKEYEAYLELWLVYHRAAEAKDGHLPYNNGGTRAGNDAVLRVFGNPLNAYMPTPDTNSDSYKKWQSAKLEAVRIAERENPRSFVYNKK